MEQYTIRPATESDIPAIQKLMTELARSDYPYDAAVDLQWAYMTDGLKYINDNICDPGKACFVVDHQKQLIGYATSSIKVLPSWRLLKVAEIENVYISENHRRNGLGKKLVQTVIGWAKELQANRIAVSVFSPNDKATGFYNAIGFSSYDITMEMNLD